MPSTKKVKIQSLEKIPLLLPSRADKILQKLTVKRDEENEDQRVQMTCLRPKKEFEAQRDVNSISDGSSSLFVLPLFLIKLAEHIKIKLTS